MKIAVTSDTHGRHFDIPECDVFIHCGDFTAGGSRQETKEFLFPIVEAIRSGIVGECILVPGNHDESFERDEPLIRAMIHSATYDGDGWEEPAADRIHLLINEGINIKGKKFFGSPFTPPFMQWYFMASERQLGEMYKAIPNILDVLITHGPPHGILDPGHNDPHVGSTALLNAVKKRKVDNHFFGHLHAAGGQQAHVIFDAGPEPKPISTSFYNVAACDEAYRLVNKPLVIEI
jgi:Icc-related predicted phosphoesterase